MRRDLVVNLAMLVVAAAAYGAIFPVNRIAAEANWPPVAFAFFQTFVSGAAMGLFLSLRGYRLLPSRRHAVAYLLIGAFAMALPAAVLTFAAGHVPTALLTLVLALSPILTLLFAIQLKLEPFRMRAVVAVLLGFAGVTLIASPWSHAMDASATNWFLLALLAPTMFAMSNVSASLLRPPATSSAVMAAGILLGGGLVALPVALIVGPGLLPPVATPGAVWSVAIACVINAIVTVLFFELVRRAGPTFFAMFNYVVVPAGVLWSILVFRELPPAVFWVALAIMFAALATAMGGRRVPEGAA